MSMAYERLNKNLNIMFLHNQGKGKVLTLTDGEKTENQVIDEIIYDCQVILDKIEQKRLIEIPCNIGDTFYGIQGNNWFQYCVKAIKITSKGILLETVYGMTFLLGEEAFFTIDEAEKKLKEFDNGRND